MSETTTSPVLIMGIGNYLMGDEGVGVHFANFMEANPLPPNVDVVDGGTGGFFLMEFFETYPTVILVDATLDNLTPGSYRCIRPRFAADFPRALSTHDIGLRDMVEGLTILEKLPDVWLFAVSISMVQSQQIELSPEVQAALPALRDEVLALIERLRQPANN